MCGSCESRSCTASLWQPPQPWFRPIGRNQGCGGCHKLAVQDRLSQLPHIYLYGTDEPGAPDGDPTCPTSPIRPGTK